MSYHNRKLYYHTVPQLFPLCGLPVLDVNLTFPAVVIGALRVNVSNKSLFTLFFQFLLYSTKFRALTNLMFETKLKEHFGTCIVEYMTWHTLNACLQLW